VTNETGGAEVRAEGRDGAKRACYIAGVMSDRFPVTVEVTRPDGSHESVTVGHATRSGAGFSVSFLPMTIRTEGGAAVSESRAPRRSSGGGGGGGEPSVFPPYGRSRGQPIAGASLNDMEFYRNGALRTLGDPGKARFHDKERALLAVIEAEIARQQGGGGGGHADDDIPPPGDEDAPPPDENF